MNRRLKLRLECLRKGHIWIDRTNFKLGRTWSTCERCGKVEI